MSLLYLISTQLPCNEALQTSASTLPGTPLFAMFTRCRRGDPLDTPLKRPSLSPSYPLHSRHPGHSIFIRQELLEVPKIKGLHVLTIKAPIMHFLMPALGVNGTTVVFLGTKKTALLSLRASRPLFKDHNVIII